MAKDNYERDYEDEVYEDDYYDEHYEEEELLEEGDNPEDSDSEGEYWDDEKRVHVSFACEDCDYRWEDTIIKKKTGNIEDEEQEDMDVICPMCGSINITQI
ncbi:MAG TPA: hypothetical protein P5295_02990 [Spirochaetota bacterium]|nr:hypothetical protein [Spirochaetota bacterium]